MTSDQRAPSAASAGAWTWNDMIGELRELGGTAENIVLGTGALGRGLFAKDAAQAIHLYLPPSLLFPCDDIEFLGDRICIKDSAAVGRANRTFFEKYERDFSWGTVGEAEAGSFIDAVDCLPSEVGSLLSTEFGLKEWFEGDRATRIRKWFLESRTIVWKGKRVVMPVIELANHASEGLPYNEFREGLQVQGQCQAGGEILVAYGTTDALQMFGTFGFASHVTVAISLPLKQKVGERYVTIRFDPRQGVNRGGVFFPTLTIQGGDLVLSHLMIGNIKAPRVSRGIFRALMREVGIPEPHADEAFDRILHFNRMRFLKLLAVLEPHEGPLIVTLRRMSRFALEAMSHCMGSWQLGESATLQSSLRISLD